MVKYFISVVKVTAFNLLTIKYLNTMGTIAKQILANGTFTTITYKTSNKPSIAQGIFLRSSQKLINKAKKEGLKVFTNNKGIAFISLPSQAI